MSLSFRTAFLLVLLAGAASADPVELTVSPAPAARNLYKWQLLPGLLVQRPGDAVEAYRQAHAAIQEVEPDREAAAALSEEMDKLGSAPLTEVDRERLKEIVTRFAKPLERIAQAARCEQVNWDFVTERLRKSGIGAILEEAQYVREFFPLLKLQARLHLLEDRPDRAIEVAATGLALGQQMNECPTLIGHLVAVAVTRITFDVVQESLQHPKCPGLYGPLTDLPRPFLPVRKAYEGERVLCYGTIPGLNKVVADPLTPIDPATLDLILRLYRGLVQDAPVARELRPFLQVADRVTLATAMQKKYDLARKALLANGYDEATVAKIPVLNANLLHAALEYEEVIGRMAAVAALPFPQARPEFDAIMKQIKGLKHGAAFPLAGLLLPGGHRVLLSDLQVQRQIALLRVAEALRQHAAQTGKWPATLDEVQIVPLPADPGTLKPFEYTRAGDVAILHAPLPREGDPPHHAQTLRLTLRKTEEKKP